MSFVEFDIISERVSKNNFKCGYWWPTIEEIQEHIEPNIEKNIEFLIWIMETADAPETDEQKASKKYINKLLIDNLKLVDQVPNSIQLALKEQEDNEKLLGADDDVFGE